VLCRFCGDVRGRHCLLFGQGKDSRGSGVNCYDHRVAIFVDCLVATMHTLKKKIPGAVVRRVSFTRQQYYFLLLSASYSFLAFSQELLMVL
jgi:hypothetical protein